VNRESGIYFQNGPTSAEGVATSNRRTKHSHRQLSVNMRCRRHAEPVVNEGLPQRSQRCCWIFRVARCLSSDGRGRDHSRSVADDHAHMLTDSSGKVRFTIIDPVGRRELRRLHALADYDDVLVTSRIWTEPHRAGLATSQNRWKTSSRSTCKRVQNNRG
jgi:hypothetical protein